MPCVWWRGVRDLIIVAIHLTAQQGEKERRGMCGEGGCALCDNEEGGMERACERVGEMIFWGMEKSSLVLDLLHSSHTINTFINLLFPSLNDSHPSFPRRSLLSRLLHTRSNFSTLSAPQLWELCCVVCWLELQQYFHYLIGNFQVVQTHHPHRLEG